ncbi:hypothetical protein [Nocardioides mesophilus]|nr:hypothetical protein [Nocardioides mesophilus]
MGGCHLTRAIPQELARAGFDVVALDQFYLEVPNPYLYLYLGSARTV